MLRCSDIHHSHRGTDANLTNPHLLSRQLGKPHAPRLGGIPNVRTGDGAGGMRELEEANADL
jgi:hypothetical protein